MNNREVNIIKEVTDGNFKNSVIFTFNSSLPFYENVLLPRFWSGGCRNNLVVMDSDQYEIAVNTQSDNITACGNVYTCDKVESKGAFHPKIIYLTNEKSGRLFIGSGNNTVQGYTKNNELFYMFDYSIENEEHLQIFQDVFKYLGEIIKKLPSRASSKRLDYLSSSTPWLARKSEKSNESFITNLNTPILSQIIELVGQQSIKKIVLSCPYFDKNLKALQSITTQYPNSKIDLLLQNDASSNFPIEMFKKLKDDFKNVKIKVLKDNNRFYHAKYIYLEGETNCLFAGSPNLSQVALLKNSTDGNYEAGVFISGKGLDVSYLWENRADETQDNIITEPQFLELESTTTDLGSFKIKITEAHIENGLLYIAYSSKQDDFTVIINGETYKGKYQKQNEFLVIDEFPTDIALRVSLVSGTGTSNTVIANNNHFNLFEDVPTVTRDVRSIYSLLLEDSERVYSIFAFSPNMKLRQGTLSSINTTFRDSVDQEEENQKVLSPDRFYVEENKDFLSQYYPDQLASHKNYSNESILYFLNAAARSLKDISKSKTKVDAITDKHEERLDGEADNQIDYRAKFESLIKRKYDEIADRLDQTDLDYAKTMNLMSILAILVISFRGIPTRDERYPWLNISINHFVEYTTRILSRLYLHKADKDILNSINENDLRAVSASMINVLSFSTSIYLLNIISKRPETIKELPMIVRTLLSVLAQTSKFIRSSSVQIDEHQKVSIANLFGIIPEYAGASIENMPGEDYKKNVMDDIINSCSIKNQELTEKIDTLVDKRNDCQKNPQNYSLFDKISFDGRSFDRIEQSIELMEKNIEILKEINNE